MVIDVLQVVKHIRVAYIFGFSVLDIQYGPTRVKT